jgi:hypothetical protein
MGTPLVLASGAPPQTFAETPAVARVLHHCAGQEAFMDSPPSPRLDAETARSRIFAEHKEIRALLGRARRLADAALDGDRPALEAVAGTIGGLRAALEAHLAFEESILIPILDDDLPLGPQRAAALRAEHAHQRSVLITLDREAAAAPQLPLLATKLAFLAEWLSSDMRDEEHHLLTRDVIRDDVVVVDQSSD